jgi:hypothetical protein
MVGDAFKSRERPSPAVLEKYYGLGKAQSWSEIAAVVDQKWGGKPLSEVLNIRPHRRGFTSPTDYPRLYRQKVQNNQGFYGPGCVSVVISELPWAVQCTWMEKGRLKDPKDTSAFGIKCDGLPDTDHKDDHVLQHKVDPKRNSKRRPQTQRPKSKSFNLDDAVNTSQHLSS